MQDLHYKATQIAIKHFSSHGKVMIPAVTKSLIHDEIMAGLFSSGLLSKVTLQGGAALQRFYYNHRFSNHLTFTCNHNNSKSSESDHCEALIDRFQSALHRVLIKKKEISVERVSPNQLKHSSVLSNQEDKHFLWKVCFPVDHEKQKDSITVKLIDAPVSHIENRFWPSFGGTQSLYQPTLLRVKNISGILQDIATDLITKPQVIYRDIWDFYYLSTQPIRTGFNGNSVIANYSLDFYHHNKSCTYQKQLLECLKNKIKKLDNINQVTQDFWSEMNHLIAPELKNQFKSIDLETQMVKKTCNLLATAAEVIENSSNQR